MNELKVMTISHQSRAVNGMQVDTIAVAYAMFYSFLCRTRGSFTMLFVVVSGLLPSFSSLIVSSCALCCPTWSSNTLLSWSQQHSDQVVLPCPEPIDAFARSARASRRLNLASSITPA